MSLADADLIARVLLDDDRHAFAQLVRTHQGATRAFLRRLTGGDAALADDLAQETFLRAYRALGSYKGTARFQSWLYGIAYRLFISSTRKKTEPVLDGDSPPETAGPARDGTLSGDLERALRQLSVDERAVIELCFHHDHTHEEASAVLGMPLGTVKTHVARGKTKLRALLQDWKEADAHA